MAAMALPTRILGTYCPLWTGVRITDIPTNYNQIHIFQAEPDGTGSGAFKFPYASAITAAEIATCRARGQRCVLTVGGQNAGFNFSNRTQSANFVNSFFSMVTALGGEIDGCDFNNFEAGIGTSTAEQIWIAQQLKAAYGANFSISAPPAAGSTGVAIDRPMLKAMNDAKVLDFLAPQYYDDASLFDLTFMKSNARVWITDVLSGDASKFCFAFGTNYAKGSTNADSLAAFQDVEKAYPKIRGVLSWTAATDKASNWAFSTLMNTPVKTISGVVTPPPTPTPTVEPTAPAWAPGTNYPLNTIVYRNGKYYKVYQVDSTKTSNGTDPEVSTWYWQVTTAPTAASVAAQVVVGTPTLSGNKKTYLRGDSLTATVTFTGATIPVGVQKVLTMRPPGGTHAGGPFIDLATATTAIPTGASTMTGTRAFTNSDAYGNWEIYATWKESDGTWHDGGSTFVALAAPVVVTPPPTPTDPTPPPVITPPVVTPPPDTPPPVITVPPVTTPVWEPKPPQPPQDLIVPEPYTPPAPPPPNPPPRVVVPPPPIVVPPNPDPPPPPPNTGPVNPPPPPVDVPVVPPVDPLLVKFPLGEIFTWKGEPVKVVGVDTTTRKITISLDPTLHH